MNIKNIIKKHQGSIHISNEYSGSGIQINSFTTNNTVTVNGKKITLPQNYNSMTINNGTVYIDGKRYSGEEEKERKEKIISFDEKIFNIVSENANVYVRIVEHKQSTIKYDANQHDIKIIKDRIDIKDITYKITSEVIIELNKNQIAEIYDDFDNANNELMINSRNGDVKVFGIEDMLNVYLCVGTANGDIKIDNWSSDDYVLAVSENGDIKANIDCLFTSLKTENGDIKGLITVFNDSKLKTLNGDIKICTSSEVKAKTVIGDVKIKNNVSDKAIITAISENGDIKVT